MTKLLLGAPNSGKTTRVLTQIVETLKEKRGNAFLVVPSSNAADVFRQRLLRIAPAEISVKALSVITTFPALYQRLLRTLGYTPSYLDSISRNYLLKKAITELNAENALTYFNKTADKDGLVKALGTFISELWQSDTDAESFARLCSEKSPKDLDIFLIFRRYQSLLDEAELMDIDGAGNYALRGFEIANEKQIQAFKEMASCIAADGFDFYAPDKVKLLSQLSNFGIETVATLTYEDDRDVHLWQRRSYKRFVEAGAEIIPFKPTSDTRLSKLAAILMCDVHTQADLSEFQEEAKKAIKIFSAPDRITEVRAIAREIKKLIIEDGIETSQITIVCRTSEFYSQHFKRVFEESYIPFIIDTPLLLSENSTIIAILHLLRLADDEFKRGSVIDILRSPYLSFSAFQFNESDIDIIEQLSYQERITQGRNLWLEVFAATHLTDKDTEEKHSISEKNQIRRSQLAEKLTILFNAVSFPGSASRSAYVRQIRSLIELLQVDAAIQQGETAGVDAKALETFYRVLETLSGSDLRRFTGRISQEKEDELSWSVFLNEVERGVTAITFEPPQANEDAIIIQEAHKLRPRNYQAVFICGLIEGEFPKRSSERFPYTLIERESLRFQGIDFAETTDDAGADLTQFHKAICRTSERLFLSYARTELSGGELLKSYLIDEVKVIARIDEERIAQMEDSTEIRGDATSNDEVALLASRVWRSQSKRFPANFRQSSFNKIDQLLTTNVKSWRNTKRSITIEERRISGKERGCYGGFILNEISHKEVQKAFGESYSWTASKINDYGNCPFKFFASSVLNLSPIEEPSEGFTYDKLGSAYHEILELTYKRLQELEISLASETLDEVATIIDEIGDAVFQGLLDSRMVRRSRLWEYETKEVKKDILNLLTVEAETRKETVSSPIAFEKRFGMAGEPPLIIEGESGKIKMRGIIDRIDETDSGLVVIDYKTSRTIISAREATEGRNLQLPIYLMAASHLLKNEKPVESGYYLHVRNYKRGSEFPNKDVSMEDLTSETVSYINEYVGKIRRAEFPIEPKQTNCHQRCPYDGLCRIQIINNATDNIE